ncbi:hypothetical protein OCAE111667_01805 [Occultella aeris]|uniref:Ribbon-helix-helix protein CopG domain-containing protein n=1 Tax=Occultella aeris TaxID=2761496 RepID=A0A7M4DGX0_9MICO|nr:hypothetical protein [Occultella aeris]VZO36163.1 hypothetical protein HALOF300_01367 [Occultella aeris]
MPSITIRTDDQVERALAELTSRGSNRSDVVRRAILELARTEHAAALRAEAEALRDDPADVAAAKALAHEMSGISAW